MAAPATSSAILPNVPSAASRLTGQEKGPEMAKLLPLIGKTRVSGFAATPHDFLVGAVCGA